MSFKHFQTLIRRETGRERVFQSIWWDLRRSWFESTCQECSLLATGGTADKCVRLGGSPEQVTQKEEGPTCFYSVVTNIGFFLCVELKWWKQRHRKKLTRMKEKIVTFVDHGNKPLPARVRREGKRGGRPPRQTLWSPRCSGSKKKKGKGVAHTHTHTATEGTN